MHIRIISLFQIEIFFTQCLTDYLNILHSRLTIGQNPVHVLEKETVYMKNNMEIKITEIKNDGTHKYILYQHYHYA